MNGYRYLKRDMSYGVLRNPFDNRDIVYSNIKTLFYYIGVAIPIFLSPSFEFRSTEIWQLKFVQGPISNMYQAGSCNLSWSSRIHSVFLERLESVVGKREDWNSSWRDTAGTYCLFAEDIENDGSLRRASSIQPWRTIFTLPILSNKQYFRRDDITYIKQYPVFSGVDTACNRQYAVFSGVDTAYIKHTQYFQGSTLLILRMLLVIGNTQYYWGWHYLYQAIRNVVGIDTVHIKQYAVLSGVENSYIKQYAILSGVDTAYIKQYAVFSGGRFCLY